MSGGEGLRCVRYELTQREFRRLRREEWSPRFISKLGKLASKLYTELYGKDPSKEAFWDDQDPVNVYPYGILERAYRELIAAGEQIGEPYREPDPALKPKKKPKKKRYPSEIARLWSYEGARERLAELVARRVAAAAAGTLTNENENNDDEEGEEWVTVEWWERERRRGED